MALSEPHAPAPPDAVPPTPAAETPKAAQRRALTVGCGAHALHDGYSDLVTILLPIWQAEFGLSYAAVGLLRSIYTGMMAGLQIPATLLAGRVGGALVLALGTALAGLCFCLAAWSPGFPWLVAALFLGGLGAATQHPIASALVARSFAGPRSITALGTYNFAGDIGKMLLPAAAALLLLVAAWRPVAALLGGLGLVAAIAIYLLLPRFTPEPPESVSAAAPDSMAEGTHRRTGFRLLLSIAAIDSWTRAGFMVFLPFLLIGKGATPATAGLALTRVFAGGAAGKLVCAQIGARFGIIGAIMVTEVLTGVGMLAVLALPLLPTLLLLPLVGVVLNGTSSLTYGSIPQFITPAMRERAFGIFYTGTLGMSALAPTMNGVIGDQVGLSGAVMVAATLTLATLPLTLALQRHLRRA